MANRPIRKWRCGNFEVAVWLNSKEKNGFKTEFKTVSLTRNYKKRDENIWRSEQINFRRLDIPKVEILLHKIKEDLFMNVSNEEGGETNE